jgi:hypothetical protein
MSEPRQHDRGGDNQGTGDVELRLPVLKPNVEIPVIELFLN